MRAFNRFGAWLVLVATAGLICFSLVACGGSKTTAADESVKLEITAPGDGSSSQADRVAVRGTVTPANATVQILCRSVQVGNGVFAGSVPLHPGANTIDVVGSSAGSAPATVTITVNRTGAARKPKARRIRVHGAPPLSAASNCGGGLTAGAHTSCPFAENVRTAFEESGSGILDVYSPTTGQTYRMYCTSGSPHVCTGGNGASVYFSSGGVTGYNLNRCAGDLVVGPNTSCPFAANVQAEYYRSGPGWISVYSPVTDRAYDMYCTGSSPHVCAGGNNAAVYFP